MAFVRYRSELEFAAAGETTFVQLPVLANTAGSVRGLRRPGRLAPEPTVTGSLFEVTALFRGRRTRFGYVVTEFDDGSRIALRDEDEKVLSDNTP
jgi:hypothetical protein